MLAACPCARAAVVNIDFQGPGGTTSTTSTGAALQPSGTIWNVNGDGYSVEVPLVTSQGATLAATLWTSGFTGRQAAGDALYSDYLAGDVELRGLDANESYELVLYSAANIATLFRLDNPWILTGASASPPDWCAPSDTVLPGVEGCNYFRGTAEADEFGVIAINANLGAIAGLQLSLPSVANPEPSILILHGIAGALAMIRRRRP